MGSGLSCDPHVSIHIHGCRSEVKLIADKKMHLDLSVRELPLYPIKFMATSENVMHFSSENRASVHVGDIPSCTSYKQKWHVCMSHLVNRVELSEVEVWVYLWYMFVSQI